MRPFLFALALSLAALPAKAEDEGLSPQMEEGMSLLSEGTRLLLQGLMEQMEPALRELQGALDNLDAYHPPEILPNGDIIIRRKTPEELAPGAGDGPGGEIEI